MSRRIAIIQGHPDALGGHFGHALADAYRWFFLAHSVKGLERNVLKFCGIRPVRETFIGMVGENEHAHARWLAKLRALGGTGR